MDVGSGVGAGVDVGVSGAGLEDSSLTATVGVISVSDGSAGVLHAIKRVAALFWLPYTLIIGIFLNFIRGFFKKEIWK